MNELNTESVQELYKFFEKIPENQWCKGSIKKKNKYCATGHLIKYIFTKKTIEFINTKFSIRNMVNANDKGRHKSAKKNVLEYLRGLLEKENYE